ncbi:MAG: hypothetical protein J6K42_02750 [Clostridia bacterium]|nr:hypothetical protein [Clostridia bacterium]
MWILENLKKIDKKVLHIGTIGLRVSFIVLLISAMMLSFYHNTEILFQYQLGLLLLALGLIFSCFFVVCILAFDKIVKDLY